MVTIDFETHVVIQDQLCYKGAMPGSSTPSITLSLLAKSCMRKQLQRLKRVPRSACEID